MRKRSLVVPITIILALLLNTSAAAIAADPIIGTWKLNVAKLKFSPVLQTMTKQGPPKEHTETYREMEGGQVEFESKTIRADGSSSSSHFIWPRQGGAVKILQGGFAGLAYVETFLGPGDWYVTALQNSKQFGVRRKIVSKNGKTMRQTLAGADPEGKPFEQVEVYDRQ